MSNKIDRRRRRQKIAKLQTWSTWASRGCNNWCNNHHPTAHPLTEMKRVRWQQSWTTKARWKRRVIEQEDEKKTRRDAIIGTAVGHCQRQRAVLCHDIAANLVQEEASSGIRINGTSTQLTVRITKSLVAMALSTCCQKVYHMKNATTTRSGKVGDRNGSVKRSASFTRNMTTAMNDVVGTSKRSTARKNGHK